MCMFVRMIVHDVCVCVCSYVFVSVYVGLYEFMFDFMCVCVRFVVLCLFCALVVYFHLCFFVVYLFASTWPALGAFSFKSPSILTDPSTTG